MKIKGQIQMMKDEAESSHEKVVKAKADMKKTDDDGRVMYLYNVSCFYRTRRDAFNEIADTLDRVRLLRDLVAAERKAGETKVDIVRLMEVLGWDRLDDTAD